MRRELDGTNQQKADCPTEYGTGIVLSSDGLTFRII